jgi:hypothetical protein
MAKFVTVLALGGTMASACFAGEAMKWKDLPEAVRTTIIANGGMADQSVDLENGKKNGMAIYEAGIKDKNGNVSDLVVTEDGKLVDTKHDDAADRAREMADRAKKAMKFSHPRDITNPYLPLATLKQDILEGSEDGKNVHIERTVMPDKRKTFKIGSQLIEALVVEDRELEDGALAEVATDYFAQDDAGTVYYLGEDVDEYRNGKITSHEGSWLLGKDTRKPGVILPGDPEVGDKFKTEDVSKDINEDDEVVSVSEDVIVPAGTYQNCVKVREHLADGTTEYKYYAKGVGVVREVPSVGDVRLKSHSTRPPFLN